MGARLRVLSGKDLGEIFAEYGFVLHSQKGSHMKFRREGRGFKDTLIVPDHAPIAPGTLKAIFRQASRVISSEELRTRFYHS